MPEDTSRRPASSVFEIGHWRFDTVSRDLTDGIRTRRLTPKAAAVLKMLADADGQVVTRFELLDRVWPDMDVCEEALTHSVAEIRRAMGGKSARQTLQTVHGTGYRVRASIRAVLGDEPPQSAAVDEEFCLEAYLDYVEARRVCERHGERALGQAVELCGAAAARAPRCAPILSEFAGLTAMRQLYCEGGGPDLQDALGIADTAVSLQPNLACGHVSRGVVLAALGRRSDACAAFNKAIVRDPLDFQAHYHYARALFAFRALPQAAQMAERAAELRPDDYRPLVLAATSRSVLGEPKQAHAATVTGLARLRLLLASGSAGARAESALGIFLALDNQHEEARHSIWAHESSRDAMLYYGVAAHAALGDVDTALDRLERVVDNGFRHADWLRADPTLEPLRSSARFKRLMVALDPA